MVMHRKSLPKPSGKFGENKGDRVISTNDVPQLPFAFCVIINTLQKCMDYT